MGAERLYLSPYCVFYPDPDNQKMNVANSLYGSKFQMSWEVFQTVAKIVAGVQVSDMVLAGGEEFRTALETLTSEKVLITQNEYEQLNQADIFNNRLNPIELAFHRQVNEGGYFPDRVRAEPPPSAQKRLQNAEYTPLMLHNEWPGDQSLRDCLTKRQSVRNYDSCPLSKKQLEYFLQVTAKSYALVELGDLGWISLRNYPSGGARYPLELYVAVENVEALPRGIYYYDPFHHGLYLADKKPTNCTLLQRIARWGIGLPNGQPGPAVVFIVTSVFARSCWKYDGIPYHLILREVGGLYQTMYLAATQLGLAPCALGAFPERAIAEMLGLESVDEAPVGMFALGTRGQVPLVTSEYRITNFSLRQGSPFSPDGASRSVELEFANGNHEIIDLDDLSLERSPQGAICCKVCRGRVLAFFDHCMEGRLQLQEVDGALFCNLGDRNIRIGG